MGTDGKYPNDSNRKPVLRSFLRAVSMLKGATLPEADVEHNEEAEALDRRLAAREAGRINEGLISIMPSACVLHMPAAAFNPSPNPDNSGELIARILQSGGNAEPVLVRQIEPAPNARYAVLVGARRLFSVDWLNRNGHPEIRLLARIVTISDEEAFLIAHRENAERPDITELSRARGLRLARDLFYGGVQARMSAALGVSRSQVSGIMTLADMPDTIVSAFGRNEDLRVRHAERLAPLLRHDLARAKMLQEAARIDREQQKLSAANLPLLPAELVVTRIRNAGERSASASVSTASIWYRGEDVGSIWRNPDGMIQLGAAIPAGVPVEPLAEAIEAALRSLR